MTDQLNLFNQAEKSWTEESQSSNNRDYNFDTVSGESVELLYHPESDEKNYLNNLGFPGQFPFTRGIHSNLYRGKLWTMRQFSGFGTPEETNERYHLLLSNLLHVYFLIH